MEHNLNHGNYRVFTHRKLGYPGDMLLNYSLDELHPGIIGINNLDAPVVEQ